MHFLNDVGKKIISPNGLQRTSSLILIRSGHVLCYYQQPYEVASHHPGCKLCNYNSIIDFISMTSYFALYKRNDITYDNNYHFI